MISLSSLDGIRTLPLDATEVFDRMTIRGDKDSGGRTSVVCATVVPRVYRLTRSEFVRWFLRRLVLKMEGGAVYSMTIREIFRRFHGVEVGLYTIGPCEVNPGNLPPGTVVGRYSSIYYTTQAIARDWPTDTILPPALCADRPNARRTEGAPARTNLTIGSDVFTGHNVIILPSVQRIGDGAFIGAGSVLHADVPPYAVVTGNPARVVRYRFSKERIKELLESKWWLKIIDELSGEIEEFQKPLEGENIR